MVPVGLVGLLRCRLLELKEKGTTLISSHWMATFSCIGSDWAREDFQRRIRKSVQKKIAFDCENEKPGKYRIHDHVGHRLLMEVDLKINLKTVAYRTLNAKKATLTSRMY